MPWSESDAKRHTKSARTPKQRRQWAHVSNAILRRTGDEARAIRGANAVVSRGERAHYGLESARR